MDVNNKGFTLVEVVAVIAIIALLGFLVMPNILNSLNIGRKSSDRILYGDIKEAMQVMYEEKAYSTGNIYYYDNNGKDESNKITIDPESKSITTNIQTLISNGFLTGVNNDDLSVNKNKRIVVNSSGDDLGTCEVKITKTMKGSKVCYVIEGSDDGVCPSTEDFGGNAQCGSTQGTNTVTFYNGSNSIGTQSINKSTKTTLTSWSSLGGSVRSGYTGWSFAGWSTSNTSNTVKYKNSQDISITGDIDLYAVYSRVLTINYNANGGSGNIDSTTKNIYINSNSTTTSSQEIILKDNFFIYDGYVFDNWTIGSNDYIVNESYEPNIQYNASNFGVTVYAKWKPNTYKVKYNGNGNTSGSMADSDYVYGTAKKLSANTFSKTGYYFAGWATSSGGSVVYSNGQSVKNLTTTNGGIVNLYAKWSLNKYTIKYNGNGNTGGSMTDSTHSYGVAKNLNTNGFVKKGYHFIGWATSADGNVVYSDGQSVTNLLTTNGEIVNLYAKWELNNYIVKYNGNGSTSGSMTDSNYVYGTAKNLSANTFAKTGYLFAGWATSEKSDIKYTDGELVTNLTSTNNGIVNLYAKWTANTYTIKYNGNGNTSGSMSDSIHSYGISKTLNINGFSKKGYTFAGWSPTENGDVLYINEESVVNLTSTNGGIVNLYAKWSPAIFVITLDKKGGTNGTTGPIYQKYETGWYSNNTATTEIASITPPTRTGYTFKGYYYTNTSGNEFQVIDSSGKLVVTNKVFSGDRTIYAKWDKITYTISYNANGGSGVPSNQTKTYGVNLTLSSTKPTREGYKFLGWSTSSTATTATYDAGSIYSSNASATLYAVWRVSDFINDVMIEDAQSDEDINFCKTSKDSNTNGIYYVEDTKNNENPIYYYRGKVDNNIIFADTCWKMVRTTETGGLKLIYNGTPNIVYTSLKPLSSSEYNTTIVEDFSFDSNTLTWTNSNINFRTTATLEFTVKETGNYVLSYENDSITSQLTTIYKNGIVLGGYVGDTGGNIELVGLKNTDVIKIVFKIGNELSSQGNKTTISLSSGTGTKTLQCNNTGINSQIGTMEYNNYGSELYLSVSDVGYMYGTRYPYQYKKMTSITDTYYYGNNVTYSNGVYTLNNTISSASWANIYNGGLNNNHYTCFTTGTTCTSVNYIYYTDSSTAYYITLSNGKKVEDALVDMLDTNTTSSTLKGDNKTIGTLDYWYYNNIERAGYSSYVEDTVWCNDRSIDTLSGWNSNGGNTREVLYFSAYNRVCNLCKPSLICNRKIDSFTVNTTNGNGKLNYPIGLLTVDEVMLAGGNDSTKNSKYYLYNGNSQHINSPSYVLGNTLTGGIYIHAISKTGLMSGHTSDATSGVRPMISLRKGFKISGGNGTVSSPYIVE